MIESNVYIAPFQGIYIVFADINVK